jgi:hypothetical protein
VRITHWNSFHILSHPFISIHIHSHSISYTWFHFTSIHTQLHIFSHSINNPFHFVSDCFYNPIHTPFHIFSHPFISIHIHSYPFTSIHTRFHTLDFISHQFTLNFISFHTHLTIHFISFHIAFTIQFTLHFISFYISFHIFSHSISQVHFTSFHNSLFFISHLFTIYPFSFHIFSQGTWKDMKRCEKMWNDTTVRIPIVTPGVYNLKRSIFCFHKYSIISLNSCLDIIFQENAFNKQCRWVEIVLITTESWARFIGNLAQATKECFHQCVFSDCTHAS